MDPWMIETIGYTASILILISLIMSSTKKLRWINLFGSLTFVFYALYSQAYPVAVLNLFTAIANVYYLYKIYSNQAYFNILKIQKNNEYIDYFLEHNRQDLNQFYPKLDIDFRTAEYSFYILRDIMPVGVFVANQYDKDTLKVDLDYVIPSYRDFKAGKYIYEKNKDIFLSRGYQKLITFSDNDKHDKYLVKMGFKIIDESDDARTYLLNLND
ncbi:YgjV family protein [Hujiaoplasma nucleasis]|uniref:YgjV family protein n=1 Tax=Hujiaoplasma nucleasis TaxID=2725268 RepID=A0A7L6N3W2_9MOLU|nr:YgjV family protein [Hujiaoplasma nucleasis]QLY39908.1 YgjV family protein [Hujiaoplasma nucleasis]